MFPHLGRTYGSYTQKVRIFSQKSEILIYLIRLSSRQFVSEKLVQKFPYDNKRYCRNEGTVFFKIPVGSVGGFKFS